MTTTKRKSRRKPKSKPLGTIWEIPDDLWEKIQPILQEFWPKKPTGRQTANWRKALNGIIFRMRTGCQWDQLPEQVRPQEHRPRLVPAVGRRRVMEGSGRCWSPSATNSAGSWQWQSADAMLGKARFGGKKTGKNPTDRGKKGPRRAC